MKFDVMKLIQAVDIFPGMKTYLCGFVGMGMITCQMFGFHEFSSDAWGALGINAAIFWKLGQDRKPKE